MNIKATLEGTANTNEGVKPKRTSSVDDITGYLETFEGVAIIGWAANKAAFGEKIEVDVIADGYLVTKAVANIFRADLLHEGIGDGKHGFKITLPESIFDGNNHSIEVRVAKNGQLLSGSPKAFHGAVAERCTVRLDGSALVGQAKLPADIDSGLSLVVSEGEQVIGTGVSEPNGSSPTAIKFRLPLPSTVFDGRPHVFSVRSIEPALTLADLAIITPHMLTPESVLQKYAREGLKPSVATAAGYRYESLARAVESLSASTAESQSSVMERLKQLSHAHARLVRGFSDSDKTFDPLVFPEVDKPDVSIVIPVHNKFPVTYHCLASLILAANRASFEVILVDDGSKDDSTRIPELIKGVQYIRNDEAEGFIRACNRGAELARGKYIVMLNNDTEVTANWLDELMWPFEHFDRVGMTGAKLLYPDGTLQEAGGIVWNTGDPWNYGRQSNPHDPRYNYSRQVDYLSGACIMLPQALWKELSGFDEIYIPAYFEDTDLAFRVRDKGLKTIYVPFAQVIHFEGVSSGTSTESGTKRFQEINRPKFKKRWVDACQHNGKVGVDLEINKDRNVRFRALVLDAETPMPDQNAGSYAAIQEMRMLQSLGFKCTFVPTNVAWMGHYTEALQRMGVECLYSPYIGSINEVIEKRGREFDLIYITRYYVAQQYIDLIRQHSPKARIVMNNADLHFLRELRAGLQAKNKEAVELSLKTRDNELKVMSKVDLVLSYTEVEKAVIISHNLDATQVAKCPWVTDITSKVPGFEERIDIAFLGGYNHHPNTEAVEWFAQRVMPLLRNSLRGVKFSVYGSHVPKSLMALAEKFEDIVIEGWVPSVDMVYNTCRVFIAPLQAGAGIKGKVIGALAHGVPCVLSPVAAEGILLRDKIDASIASRPEDWVTAISRLYTDQQSWAAMSQQAIGFAQVQYGFEKGVSQMQEALQQVELFTTAENETLAMH